MSKKRTDRLSQIWGGFAQRTTLDVSGTDIDATPRPMSRRETDEAMRASLDLKAPLNVGHMGGSDPVASALTAMHAQLAAQAKRKKPGGRSLRETRQSLQATAELAALRQAPQTPVDKTLLADLAFTQSKTERGSADYLRYAADRQVAWQRRKRKKFLGLF